jgi:hypothetical protein
MVQSTDPNMIIKIESICRFLLPGERLGQPSVKDPTSGKYTKRQLPLLAFMGRIVWFRVDDTSKNWLAPL